MFGSSIRVPPADQLFFESGYFHEFDAQMVAVLIYIPSLPDLIF